MKKTVKIKRTKYILSLFLATFVITAGVAVAYVLNTYNTGWRVDSGKSKDVWYGTDNDINTTANACVKVTNNSGSNLFVPTRTVAEKNAFCANAPTGASCGSCTSTPPPGSCSNYNISWTRTDKTHLSESCRIWYGDSSTISGTSTCNSGYSRVNVTQTSYNIVVGNASTCTPTTQTWTYTATCQCN